MDFSVIMYKYSCLLHLKGRFKGMFNSFISFKRFLIETIHERAEAQGIRPRSYVIKAGIDPRRYYELLDSSKDIRLATLLRLCKNLQIEIKLIDKST